MTIPMTMKKNMNGRNQRRSFLQLLEGTCHVGIFPRLAKASSHSILIIVSNHVDVLTYFAWKVDGFSGYLFFRANKEDIDSVNEKTAAKYGSVAAPIIVEKTTSSTMVAEPVWSRHVSQFWRNNNAWPGKLQRRPVVFSPVIQGTTVSLSSSLFLEICTPSWRFTPPWRFLLPLCVVLLLSAQGVPQHYWTANALRTIGEDVGSVELVDTEQIRVRVNINALQPLEQQIPILLPTGETTMVDLVYEKLEKHCFLCFSLLHEKKDCPSRVANTRRGSPEAENNKSTYRHRSEDDKRNPSSKRTLPTEYRGNRDKPQDRWDRRSQSRYEHRSQARQTSIRSPHHPRRKELPRASIASRLREPPSVFENRGPRRSSPNNSSRRYPQAPRREPYSARKSCNTEWRERRSPLGSRSFQATNGSPRASRNSDQRIVASQSERSPVTPPPAPESLPPPPPASLNNRAAHSSPKSRRPALERISLSDQPDISNHFPVGHLGESSSPFGRLQEVNIQYLGEEDQNLLGLNRTSTLVGASSNPIHPTLSHRLSLGEGVSLEASRRSALQRVEEAQPTITVSIQANPPKKKPAAKKKIAAPGLPRGARSPLQGASTRKRNTVRPKATAAARKRLCAEQLPYNKDPVTDSQCSTPALVVLPASKKAKTKAAPLSNASHGWRGILAGREILRKGLGWIVGDGEEISLWNSPWLSTSSPKCPLGPPNADSVHLRVKDLLCPLTHQWSLEAIRKFLPHHEENILSLVLSSSKRPDKLRWLPVKSGNYSSKSGYAVGRSGPALDVEDQFNWQTSIWKVKTSPKIRMFLWKSARRALPVGTALARRGIVAETECKRCGQLEDAIHIFFRCPFAAKVWDLAPIINKPTVDNSPSMKQLLTSARKSLSLPPVGLGVTPLYPWILWFLWKVRNYFVFEDQKLSEVETLQKAITEARSWQEAKLQQPSPKLPSRQDKVTEALGDAWLCFSDAAWKPDSLLGGMGWIVLTPQKILSLQGSTSRPFVSSALVAEALALKAGINAALASGVPRLACFSDCQELVLLLNSEGYANELDGILADIFLLKNCFISISFHFVSRSENAQADALAKAALLSCTFSSPAGV
ncbi:unnamed protein product [Arabidopsis arenosa]|uniref:RNase H type-1 domain-containing protein n=1 Tax=Arabidopsis arenosa TaxID=38785 RepID=A0A8S1ZII5_ARAAE|nr:unnamed protein product [Arabidopsis arenosa]